jgi:hypothetical protein
VAPLSKASQFNLVAPLAKVNMLHLVAHLACLSQKYNIVFAPDVMAVLNMRAPLIMNLKLIAIIVSRREA